MPIYEYVCTECDRPFEKLVVAEEVVVCPGCNGVKLEKQYSRFGMSSSTSGSNYPSLPMYKSGGGCCCNPGSCGCKN